MTTRATIRRNPTARPIRVNPHPMRETLPLLPMSDEDREFLRLRRERAR